MLLRGRNDYFPDIINWLVFVLEHKRVHCDVRLKEFCWVNLKGREHLGDPSIDGRIILIDLFLCCSISVFTATYDLTLQLLLSQSSCFLKRWVRQHWKTKVSLFEETSGNIKVSKRRHVFKVWTVITASAKQFFQWKFHDIKILAINSRPQTITTIFNQILPT
jgi:hypothetical protein